MDKSISVRVNGTPHVMETEAARSLLEVLREDLGLTGTKYGCGEGRCGACTVLVDGQAVHACTTSIEDVEGTEIVTIEGLASGPDLHPLQEAFLTQRAMQCGFCTPGMILEAVALLREKPTAAAADIIAGMDGHICRCGSYPRILQAIERAATKMRGQNP
jgi:aerobic-type carbon monoxide dehydrogenase small subunit (CoxS/CutS family)